jgi:hypothetical protein
MKIIKNFSLHGWSPGKDLKLGSPKYEVGINHCTAMFSEITEARRSVLQGHTFIKQESSITLGHLITQLCQESICNKRFIQATFSVVNVSFHQLFTPFATFRYILE